MASSYGAVSSVLNEKPPATGPWSAGRSQSPEPTPFAVPPVPVGQESNHAWHDSLLGGHEYDVVYDDANGYPLLAFAEGQWYDVTTLTPRPVSVRYALRLDPAWAGAVVQTVCLWMRSHPSHDRSFELATELALTVGELARVAG